MDTPWKNELPPWRDAPDCGWGTIHDAKGNFVADCFINQYSADRIKANRDFILKACNLHAELAELVVDLGARWDKDDHADSPELGGRLQAALEKLWDTEYERPKHWLDDMSCLPVPGRLLTIEQVRAKARAHVAYGWSMRLDGDWSKVQREAYMHEWKMRGGQ